MPISKSAKKSLRSSKRKYVANNATRKKLKETLKKTNKENINKTYSLIDKATKVGIINKNKAARMKSTLSKKISATPHAEEKKSTKKTARKSVKSRKTSKSKKK